MSYLTSRHRGLRGRGMGLGGILSPFHMFGSRGLLRDPFGHSGGHSLYGFDCDSRSISYDGEHMCSCYQEIRQGALAEYQIQEAIAIGLGGCDCPECPLERHGYGGGGCGEHRLGRSRTLGGLSGHLMGRDSPFSFGGFGGGGGGLFEPRRGRRGLFG